MRPHPSTVPGTVTLADVPTGHRALVIATSTTPELSRRLAELGVRPGVTLTVVQHTSGNGRVIDISGVRYAVDHRTLTRTEVRHV